MNPWVNRLLLLLLIQVCVLLFVRWSSDVQRQEALAPGRVTSLNPAAIDEIRIGDEYDNSVVLRRSGQRWVLPESQGLPAGGERVEALIAAVTRPLADWPVAQSSAARQRFQVADYYYQRQVELFVDGETAATVYLGTAPGFRKVHARSSDSDDIYSIDFNTFDAPAIGSPWLDTRLLQVRTPLRIDADAYSLSFDDGTWHSGTGGEPDAQELGALLAALRTLQVEGIADQDAQRDLAGAEATLEMSVQGLAGAATLSLYALDNAYFIHSSEYPLFFTLSAAEFDRLAGIDAMLVSGEGRGR